MTLWLSYFAESDVDVPPSDFSDHCDPSLILDNTIKQLFFNSGLQNAFIHPFHSANDVILKIIKQFIIQK